MQRNTIQRQIILDTLKKLATHPTVDEIYAEIQKEHKSISKTTVYRNLHQLAENELIRSVSPPDGLVRYDGNVHRHIHFKCKDCSKVFDVDIDLFDDIGKSVQQKYGFKVDMHEIVFSGICSKC